MYRPIKKIENLGTDRAEEKQKYGDVTNFDVLWG